MSERYFLLDPNGNAVGSVTPADFRHKKTVRGKDGKPTTYQDAGYTLGGNEITNAPYEEPKPATPKAAAEKDGAR